MLTRHTRVHLKTNGYGYKIVGEYEAAKLSADTETCYERYSWKRTEPPMFYEPLLAYVIYFKSINYKNMKTIKSNFAQINEKHKLIELLEESPCTNGLQTTIEDVTIEIEGNILRIDAKLWNWGFLTERTFVEDMENKPIKSHTKLGYKSITDFFKGIKKPYVKSGWFIYEKLEPYKAEMSQWFLSL